MYQEQHDALKAAFKDMSAEREQAFAMLGERREADAQREHELAGLRAQLAAAREAAECRKGDASDGEALLSRQLEETVHAAEVGFGNGGL